MNYRPIDYKLLMSKISYDAESGSFTWIATGKKAGCYDKSGYLKVRIFDYLYLGHRLAWAIHNKQEAFGLIDHINGDKHDNRILNLRIATRRQNSYNSKTPKKRTCKLKGATYHKGVKLYKSSIGINGKSVHIGWFKTEQGAHEAYVKAAVERDSEFNNSGAQ